MSKEIKDMTNVELVQEFEAAIIRGEKFSYSRQHKLADEMTAEIGGLREAVLERMSEVSFGDIADFLLRR